MLNTEEFQCLSEGMKHHLLCAKEMELKRGSCSASYITRAALIPYIALQIVNFNKHLILQKQFMKQR